MRECAGKTLAAIASLALMHPLRRLPAEHVVDVFVYITVLNLAAEFVPQVIAESFSMSLLTALVLKAVLELVVRLKKALAARISSADRLAQRAVAIAALGLLLPGSKLAVLWLLEVIFRGEIVLGGFWAVTALILVLMAARAGVRLLLSERVGQVGLEPTTDGL